MSYTATESGTTTFLAMDTATPLGTVAVGDGHELRAEITLGVRARHSESLLPAIDFALTTAGVEPAELGAIIVGAGPGSFTGIRIAAAAAKAFAHTLDLPLLAAPSLMAVAANGAGRTEPVCAMFDARRGDVYAGCYRFGDDGTVETVLEVEARPVEVIVRRLADRNPIFNGDGAVLHRETIEELGGRVAPVHTAAPRSSALIWLATQTTDAVQRVDPATWEPAYVRPAGVTPKM